ncbi:hypothetical protein DEALK_19130 [Dehalogenimonas alkenigignens]|uniref:Uncharacterized protein n=1 Tax=Dehalogenimonas alkenigignens TaxID=1217799 RepID=A0A0W0GKK0_9CHLR|nr:hypothetical protein DEALK_19130 [Dehalogenimonas alkenigignens]
MKVKNEATTFLLLWGGALSPDSLNRVMYWAVNCQGEICGVILPAAVWRRVVSVLESPSELGAPYLAVAVTGIAEERPELRLVTLNADSLYDFCYLKNAVYRMRQSPQQLKMDAGKLTNSVGIAEMPPLAVLRRFGSRPDRGEFFTLMPDKKRVELYYLIEENEIPPEKLGVQVLWGLKGYGLPAVAQGTGYRPDGAEKAMLGRSAVKPPPLWFRDLLKLFKRGRRPPRSAGV